MLHCHHHPSVRPVKLSSLFGNSSNHSSCPLQQLNSSFNDALNSDGAQYWNGKRRRCLHSRMCQPFSTTSIAMALQTYDLQEHIRKINFHERVEFSNCFQHHSKYFLNAPNPRKRARNSQLTSIEQVLRNTNWLNELSAAQITQLIRNSQKHTQQIMRTDAEDSEGVQTVQPNVTTSDYVHTSLFGSDYSAKIVPQNTHKRTNSAPSATTGSSLHTSSPGFFSQFPADSLSLVGVGGFGRVYRVNSKQNGSNDQRLAVKIIPFNSSKQRTNVKQAPPKYFSPILAAAALLVASTEEDEQRTLEESHEKQVLREVAVLSTLSCRNTARYRWAFVDSWSEQFEQLFNRRDNGGERSLSAWPSNSASVSPSASFSDTSSEWRSNSNASVPSVAEGPSRSDSIEAQLHSTNGLQKPKYDSVLVLMMDYHDGISLSQFIANPSAHVPPCLSHTTMLSALLRLYLSYQILTSLEYVHANHCIHRDVAPKNLLVEIDRALLSSAACDVVDEQRMDALLIRLMSNQVSADDLQDSDEWKAICATLAAFNVRLIDFGLSTQFRKHADTPNAADAAGVNKRVELTVGVGTAAYAPPEQLRRVSACACKQSSCNVCGFAERGDIFSCGLVMSEMLCAPFQTQMERLEFLTQMRDRRWNQVAAFQALPKLLKDVVCGMIHPLPSGRPSASEAKKSKAFHAVRKLLPFITVQRYEHCAD